MTHRITKRRFAAPLAALLLVGAGATGWYALGGASADTAPTTQADIPLAQTDADIKVFKTATCGCCKSWVAHLEESGLDVEAVNVDQGRLNEIKQTAGLTRELASCHTAFIDGYVVEGHVPASDIRQLLAQRPDVRGLSVPGMPVGSPGMEMGGRQDPYDVLAFDSGGDTTRFASHNR